MGLEHLGDFHREMYRRNILLNGVGEAGQIRLLNSRVLVVGLGGLGSPALLYLAAAGVGEIGILDSDRVESSNLQRQILHGMADLGREKTASAEESVHRLNPEIRVHVHPLRLTEENAGDILSFYDFIIDATDNFETRFLVNDTCVRLGKPFSHAGIVGTHGQAMTVVPGEGPCFRCIFEDVPPPGEVETTDEAGILGSVAGVMGSIQATEAVKYLLNMGNLLVGRLLTWDALAMRFREITLPPGMRCGVCGTHTEKSR